jgi:hypothetical protein
MLSDTILKQLTEIQYSRWPPLLKIEFSLIDHYFFILHQNELKFKMLLHDSAGNFKFVSNSIAYDV